MTNLKKPLCGARTKSTAQPCKNIAGKGTDHGGQGRCRFHGGATPIKHGMYSKVVRPKVGERIAQLANSSELLDLRQEQAVLKSYFTEYLEKFDSISQAILDWHRSSGPAYQTLLHSNDATPIHDAILKLREADHLKPVELPNPDILFKFIEKIGKTSERIYKTEDTITLTEHDRLTDQMADVVVPLVDAETLKTIRDGWNDLSVEVR